MKKIVFVVLALCILIPDLFCLVLAHPGGTDSNGGHYDRSTGEYHYHHGYPAHQHDNGVCPYDFDDRTGENSGSSSGGVITVTTKSVTSSSEYESHPSTKSDATEKALFRRYAIIKVVSSVGALLLLFCLFKISWFEKLFRKPIGIYSGLSIFLMLYHIKRYGLGFNEILLTILIFLILVLCFLPPLLNRFRSRSFRKKNRVYPVEKYRYIHFGDDIKREDEYKRQK